MIFQYLASIRARLLAIGSLLRDEDKNIESEVHLARSLGFLVATPHLPVVARKQRERARAAFQKIMLANVSY